MTESNEDYTPYGAEWEAQVSKLPKGAIINMLRNAAKGSAAKDDAVAVLISISKSPRGQGISPELVIKMMEAIFKATN